MEFTKFALNFYLYCLVNPDIRKVCSHMIRCKPIKKPARVSGQPINPISQCTKSTRFITRSDNKRPNRSKNLPRNSIMPDSTDVTITDTDQMISIPESNEAKKELVIESNSVDGNTTNALYIVINDKAIIADNFKEIRLFISDHSSLV
ncbi:unnamed protein product [Thelazia callipaeda]|uniref:THAP-type domain-containing protein n=1 Tax=Thelazia callipaeda TaxID=103827 RepID=A0A0N5CRG3_THECL|nr:unnamed protein product [Thelazia callipaeda]